MPVSDIPRASERWTMTTSPAPKSMENRDIIFCSHNRWNKPHTPRLIADHPPTNGGSVNAIPGRAKPQMLMLRMPSRATPRSTSIEAMRSLGLTGVSRVGAVGRSWLAGVRVDSDVMMLFLGFLLLSPLYRKRRENVQTSLKRGLVGT